MQLELFPIAEPNRPAQAKPPPRQTPPATSSRRTRARARARSQSQAVTRVATIKELRDDLAQFNDFGAATRISEKSGVPVYHNEFWTARQRGSHSLHEISYRACFKAELPRFFMERLSRPGELVYDPFLGRGTTLLEATLCGRRGMGCDLNPLSSILVLPRLNPPTIPEIEDRLQSLDLDPRDAALPEELLVFYHPQTLGELVAMREYFLERERTGNLDRVDAWLRMVAVNRLTGHSKGFFSVYTLPPNQATSVKAQLRINTRRNQTPEARDVRAILRKKSVSLLRDGTTPPGAGDEARVLVGSADHTPEIATGSVDLVVTSPPFLNTINYATDNWLRGWFCGFETQSLNLAVTASVPRWREFISGVFSELGRVVRKGGWIAFEVGEVRKGKILLEDEVLLAAKQAGLAAHAILINEQDFTKTANCWGVDNQTKGTNSNRIVLFQCRK